MRKWFSVEPIKGLLFQNIANGVTVIGFLLTIWLLILFVCSPQELGVVILVAGGAALTDLLDGYLAKSLGIKSYFGGMADRIRDKFYIGVALLGSAWHYWPAKRKLLPLAGLTEALVLFILAIEILLAIALFVGVRGKLDIKPSQIGRIKMFLQSVAVMGWFLFLGAERYFGWDLLPTLIYLIDLVLFAVACFALASLEGYWRRYKK